MKLPGDPDRQRAEHPADEDARLNALLEAGRRELPTAAQLQRVWDKAGSWKEHKPPLFLLDSDGLPLPTRARRADSARATAVPACQAVPAGEPVVESVPGARRWWWPLVVAAVAAGVLVLASPGAPPATQSTPPAHARLPAMQGARAQGARAQGASSQGGSLQPERAQGESAQHKSTQRDAVEPRPGMPPGSPDVGSGLGSETSNAPAAVPVTRRPVVGVTLPDSTRREASQGGASEVRAKLPTGTPPPPVAAAPPLSALQTLQAAQDQLKVDASRSLALLADHERRFPSSPLAQEREVLRIDALLRVGRRADAQSRADAFVARYPDSSHVRRIRLLLQH